MLIALYQETNSQRLDRAENALTRACYAVVREATGSAANALTDDLTGSTSHALEAFAGVEGGVWRAGVGSLAYAFPSYEGSGVKTDLPQAEVATILEVAESTVAANRPVAWKRDASSQVLMLQGCPFPGKSDLAAWVMTRVVTVGGRPFLLATTGLALLLIVLLGSAVLLARVLWRWSLRLRAIEGALASGSVDLPVLELTGQRDLDRIVRAINGASIAATEARQRSEELRQQVAEGERLAALGRLAAGVAHEIRNPMAAMRLKAENALAENKDPLRTRDALRVVIDQVARMEQLVQNLLRSVQRPAVRRETISDVKALLKEHVDLFSELAGRRPISVQAPEALDPPAYLDPSQIGRALDNLILNAIQNSSEGAPIDVSARSTATGLEIAVADHGNGVATEIRDCLFEPFATRRADGTGLGLAIVREIAEAHGGRAIVEHRANGTTFFIELPSGAS